MKKLKITKKLALAGFIIYILFIPFATGIEEEIISKENETIAPNKYIQLTYYDLGDFKITINLDFIVGDQITFILLDNPQYFDTDVSYLEDFETKETYKSDETIVYREDSDEIMHIVLYNEGSEDITFSYSILKDEISTLAQIFGFICLAILLAVTGYLIYYKKKNNPKDINEN